MTYEYEEAGFQNRAQDRPAAATSHHRLLGDWAFRSLIWDPWDFPEPTEEEAAATLTSLTQRLEDMAAKARAQPDWTEPSEQQKAEATRRLEERMESYRAQKAAVRAFTAKVERERAERTAMTNLHGNRRFLCRISMLQKNRGFCGSRGS